MKVARLDHLVLTVNSIEVTSQFYSNVLGMDIVTFGEGRVALTFGEQKINLHQLGNEFEPKAAQVKSGSADLCFITHMPIHEVQSHIESQGVTIIDGPIQRTGAMGKIISVYLRDPDGNLIELSNYL
ncbi:lactoylglutathione lyase family protein [Aliivibrio fischeri ES114]|uniref:Lactoylglutathione lyase family protein n=1 Tax=Aliivibrio fischeri (strain ATCC 700601 / ES114) TaxID=312309 RepID=Q5E5E0_ALIF1|nr:VOC family protein [Aliivibrio fischeri]AAW85756.1 lactoylglutathione lyase family protein [Aliivibrio fischeri ES114]KLU79975.1 glyoxalase [Aliivibrio fischeri]MUK42523.1 VOC family protein [Aliivibrio fischeri]MUL16238.1 VOC family protein [Aliivibrio fischeri]TDM54320.1 VOC family protein [Aliivibrio fischeri]